MKAKLLNCFLLLATIFVASSFAATQNEIVVRVKAETTLQSDRFTLGEIAEVQASDAKQVERLRSIVLGYAPNVGTVRELTADRIRLALAAAGFDRVRVEAPTIVRLKCASQFVAPDLVRTKVEEAILAGLRVGEATARVVRLDLPTTIEVPSGTVEVQVANTLARNLLAPFTIGVELRTNGIVVKRLSLTAQVEVRAPTLVALRDILPHGKIRAGDVAVELRQVQSLHRHIGSAENLRGYAARSIIAQGDAITHDKLMMPLIIKAGDSVRIEGTGARVNVVVAGEARGSGRVGDRIRVKNIASNQMLQGVVVDEGVVQVRF